MVIPGSWIVGLIVRFPAFLDKNFVKKRNSCLYYEKWTKRVADIVYYVYGLFSCIVVVVLYSRVVYTLWFKRNDDIVLTHQHKVWVFPETDPQFWPHAPSCRERWKAALFSGFFLWTHEFETAQTKYIPHYIFFVYQTTNHVYLKLRRN